MALYSSPLIPPVRYMSSLSSGSQPAALSRLSEIEKRVNSRRQAIVETQQATKSAPDLTSDLRASATAVDTFRSAEAPEQLSAHSSSDQSHKNSFLKKKAAGSAASADPIIPDGSGRSRTRATEPVGLKLKPGGGTRGVSLDSDEEDMKKLLGDSMESTDYSSSGPKRSSPVKRLNKVFKSECLLFYAFCDVVFQVFLQVKKDVLKLRRKRLEIC